MVHIEVVVMRTLKKALWPHIITIGQDESTVKVCEIETWLGKQLGCFKGRWNVVYQYNKTDFYFRQGRDATLFALRWSS